MPPVPMKWEFFLAACVLTGAMLLPHAPSRPIIGGMLLAGVIRIGWNRLRPPRPKL